MTDYKKLVKALRCVELRLSCNECEYGTWSESGEAWSCELERKDTDAADAIEALQAEVLKYHDAFGRLSKTAVELEQRIAELKASYGKTPKRGEWIGVSPIVDTAQCSVCGGQLFSAELETPYCPYCGAEMEVQE